MSATNSLPDNSSPASNERGPLDALAEELREVKESDFVHINVDVVGAVTTALGILPKLEKLKDAIGKLPAFEHSLVDKFETYVLALHEAHTQYLTASRPPELLPELLERGVTLRDRLYADVQALVVRKLVSAEEVREVRTGVGHKALAMDLAQLAEVVQRKWKDIEAKTSIHREEVDEADQLGTQLLRVIGEREQAPAVLAEATARRARAYALFVRSYDEVRRAVMFLRWQDGDADQIAPSLYQGRGGRKKVEPTVPASPAPGAPGNTPPVPPSTTPAPSVPVGDPESEPFTNA